MKLLFLILFALLIDFPVAVALGKLMKRSASHLQPVDEPMQYDASEPYPRWYE